MPKRNEIIQFKNYENKQRVPFSIYEDFKCSYLKIHASQPYESKSYANKYRKYEPDMFCDHIKYEKEYYKPPVVYRGPNAVKKFVSMLTKIAIKIKENINGKIDKYESLKSMIDFDENHCKRTNIYHKWEKEIHINKVKHHCHLTGKYRDPAHADCNLKYRDTKIIPVKIHNLSGNEFNLFIKELRGKINAIANTEKNVYILLKIQEVWTWDL